MKEYELKLMNENNNKKINIYFKDNRVIFYFVDGDEDEGAVVTTDFINNYLKKKGYKIIGCDIII